jgi:hypothetical protein
MIYNPRALEEMDAIVRKYRLADKSNITNLPCPQAMADAAASPDRRRRFYRSEGVDGVTQCGKTKREMCWYLGGPWRECTVA